MRTSVIGWAVLTLLIPGIACGDDLGYLRLGLIEGDVQVLIKDTTDWTDGVVNLPLGEGDRLWVPDGARTELQVRGGVMVRADGDTSLDTLTVSGDSAQFYLERGHAYVNNRRGGIATVQIDTPLSSFRSYDNSIMMIDVTADGMTEVSVIKGYIYAENRAGATRVTAGNTLTIRVDESADLSPIGAPDEWERWNKDRDRRRFAGSESSRYLPDELQDYASDLDDSGRWQFAPTYGYVWTPTVVVSAWAPYTFGNWVWIRGSYVWVPYDPWCWAPSHFGRWVVVPSLGWSWVPPAVGAAYWGPGYVGWYVTPAAVAWVPLAPGEIYYGYGYYGPWSINISTINVTNVAPNHTYVNAREGHGVTVVDRDTFGTGRRGREHSGGNPFLDHNRREGRDIAVVPPRDRPSHPVVLVTPEAREREHHAQPPPERERPQQEHRNGHAETAPQKREALPSVRPVTGTPAVAPPPVKQHRTERISPPEQVQRIRPDAVKNERRVVKEREASVFNSQPPASLPVKKLHVPREIRRPAGNAPGAQTQHRGGQGENNEGQQQQNQQLQQQQRRQMIR
jgi:hypothetical protein